MVGYLRGTAGCAWVGCHGIVFTRSIKSLSRRADTYVFGSEPPGQFCGDGKLIDAMGAHVLGHDVAQGVDAFAGNS